MNRRMFISASGASIAGLLGASWLLTGCGGSSSPSAAPTAQGGNCLNNGVSSTVEVLHTPNHDLFIPKEDVGIAVDKTYILGDNGSGHIHTVTITTGDFQKLQNGQGVQIASNGPGHIHMVTINCA